MRDQIVAIRVVRQSLASRSITNLSWCVRPVVGSSAISSIGAQESLMAIEHPLATFPPGLRADRCHSLFGITDVEPRARAPALRRPLFP